MSKFESQPPQVIQFNSKDRIGGTNSNFTSSPIDIGYNNYDSVVLLQASIPRSFYNVPTLYNTFVVKEGVNTRTITIPSASYNRYNLPLVLAPLLNTGGVGWTYTMTYPTANQGDTFKFTWTVSGNGGVQPQFVFTNSMFRQLGFDQSSTNNFVANSLTSVNCINLSYILRAFIKSNICLNASDSILEEILNYSVYPMLSTCYFEQRETDLNTRTFNPNIVNSWNFRLVDSYDQEIDLNEIPWSFTIAFFRRANYHEVAKEELRIKNEQRLFGLTQQLDNIENEKTSLENQRMQIEELRAQIKELTPTFDIDPEISSSVIDKFIPEPLPSATKKK